MREWVITNGIGGFASSTDKGGMNTRRYHGLLTASLNPPNNRTLILSKIDESIEINGKKFDLFTNEVNNEISEGYKFQYKFDKDIIPIYTYKVRNIIIEKTICMIHKKNAVIVQYKISNRKNKVKLNLTPLINFRDFHDENHSTHFDFKQSYKNNILQVKLQEGVETFIYINNGTYQKHENDIFKGMQYSTEKERGFDFEENHYVPGTFKVEIKPNEDKIVQCICSINGKYGIELEDIKQVDCNKVIRDEYSRIKKQIVKSKLLENVESTTINSNMSDINKVMYEELVKKYIVASDNFIIYRDSNNMHSMLAGLPWFLDWGRDTFIAFEGILLISRRFDIAKEVLLTFSQNINQGLIPNGFSEYDGTPLYNSADSALLFIDAVNKYIIYTGDYEFVKKNLYDKMKKIIKNYINGIDIDDNNIYMDKNDNLIVTGTDKTQNTWMDAKVGDKAITPRSGKAVEINAMWYNALKIMEQLNDNLGYKTNPYTKIAKNIQQSFGTKFFNIKKCCLYDVVETYQDRNINDDKIRPNQIFALSMTYPVIDPKSDVAKKVFVTVTKQLLNKFGLKTLANNEPGYAPIYEGNPAERDSIYHQGVTWTWLLGPYYDTLKNLISSSKGEIKDELEEELLIFRIKVAKTFTKELYKGNTIGSICELYDSQYAKKGKGAFAQAWSVSEVFRIIFGK